MHYATVTQEDVARFELKDQWVAVEGRTGPGNACDLYLARNREIVARARTFDATGHPLWEAVRPKRTLADELREAFASVLMIPCDGRWYDLHAQLRKDPLVGSDHGGSVTVVLNAALVPVAKSVEPCNPS